MKQQTKELGNFTVNYTESDLITYYVNEWVMRWVREYHPEAFEKAEAEIKRILKDTDK